MKILSIFLILFLMLNSCKSEDNTGLITIKNLQKSIDDNFQKDDSILREISVANEMSANKWNNKEYIDLLRKIRNFRAKYIQNKVQIDDKVIAEFKNLLIVNLKEKQDKNLVQEFKNTLSILLKNKSDVNNANVIYELSIYEKLIFVNIASKFGIHTIVCNAPIAFYEYDSLRLDKESKIIFCIPSMRSDRIYMNFKINQVNFFKENIECKMKYKLEKAGFFTIMTIVPSDTGLIYCNLSVNIPDTYSRKSDFPFYPVEIEQRLYINKY